MFTLPAYTVRESTRAKHVRLTLSPHDGLVVVVPTGFDRRRIPSIVSGKAAWIRKHTQTLDRQRLAMGVDPAVRLPERIDLPAMGRTWAVSYRPSPGTRTSLVEEGFDRLVVSRPQNDSAAQRALRQWLLRQGRGHLTPALQRRASDHGFEVKRVRIGCQKSRWGSCSSRGTISLNAKLLFLPPEWVHYVLMHELCHTREMNHSDRFWQLLERHVPNARDVRKGLREAWVRIPAWVARPSSLES